LTDTAMTDIEIQILRTVDKVDKIGVCGVIDLLQKPAEQFGAGLDLPVRWYTPRRIFVNSTSDLFHEKVPDEWIDSVFCVMGAATRHTFQVLTKRPERMRDYLTRRRCNFAVKAPIGGGMVDWHPFNKELAVPPNVWLGTSIEDQATADERIPHLLATPAAVRFVSAEPLLGPVDLQWAFPDIRTACCHRCGFRTNAVGGSCPNDGSALRNDIGLDWVICGGESGPGARPMHPAWARSLRAQCLAAGVPFFFKQWGEWAPDTGPFYSSDPIMQGKVACAVWNGQGWDHYRDCYGPPTTTTDMEWMYRLGKKRAGRLLDGREWNEVPNG